jgi:hypothetical protein
MKKTTLFAVVPEWVIYSVSGNAVKLYAVLQRISDKESGRSWPGRKTLGRMADINIKTVDKCIDELVLCGALTVEKRHRGDGSLTSNTYFLHADPPPNFTPPTTKNWTTPTQKMGRGVYPKNGIADTESVDPESDGGSIPRTPSSPACAGTAGTSVNGLNRTNRTDSGKDVPIPEPSPAQEDTPHPNAVPSGNGHDPDGFARFWSAYPAKGKESKKLARKVWQQAGLERSVDEVLAGVSRWKDTERWHAGYVKGAHRFLRDEMYLERPPAEVEPDADDNGFVRREPSLDELPTLAELGLDGESTCNPVP